MAEKQFFVTPEGLAKLRAELEHLRTVRRHEIADKIRQAKELGSTVNNAEYDDAKNELAFVVGRILTLENTVKNAVIIQAEEHAPFVKPGAHVTVRTEEGGLEDYFIVGSAEADPKAGRISNESPVGRAMLGKRVGEDVEVLAPAGVVKFTIVEIK